MEIIIFFQKIFTSPIEHESFNPLKHGEYLTRCIHWIFEEEKMYFLPLWCQTIYGWRGLWRGRSSPPGTNKPCPAAIFLFLFSFICCHHRLCNHHLYNHYRAVIIRAINIRAITICANTILWSSPLELSSLHPSSSQSSPSKPSWHLHQWDRRRRRWFWSDRSKQLRTQIARCGLQRCPAQSGYW